MVDSVTIIGGVLHHSGTYYLLVETDDADDDEAVVAVGRSDGSRIALKALTGLEEIVSIIVLEGEWAARAEAACLTAEGVVYFLSPAGAQSEIIPGSGYEREDALDLGRMTTLREQDGWLFAMGFGGQVYRRRVESSWENISIPERGDNPPSPPSLYAVADGPRGGSFVFGGVNVGEYVETDDIEAASDAGDADRLADLILDAIGVDKPTIRIYDGGWSEVEFDGTGTIGPILRESRSSWILFVSTGLILRTSEFQSFEDVYADDPGVGWGDVKVWRQMVLVVGQGGTIFVLNDGLVEFPTQPPASPSSSLLSLSPSDALLAAMYPDAVMLFDGESWARLVPTM